MNSTLDSSCASENIFDGGASFPGRFPFPLPGLAQFAVMSWALVFLYIAERVIKFDLSLRQRLTHQTWYRIQILVHPIFVGGSIFLANWTGNDLYGLLGVPFVFNFGAEPFDTSIFKGTWFIPFLYLHHAGAILACLNPFAIATSFNFALANGLLFAHIWLLHTMVSLDHRKIIEKQRYFWPYMIEGFLATAYWFLTVRRELGETVSVVTVAPLLVPLLCQFGGRWLLYLEIRRIMGWPREGDKLYDRFETKKQYYELGALLLSASFLVFL